MKGYVKSLEAKMVSGCSNEGNKGKQICDGLDAKMEAGFRNEAWERTKVHEQLTRVSIKVS